MRLEEFGHLFSRHSYKRAILTIVLISTFSVVSFSELYPTAQFNNPQKPWFWIYDLPSVESIDFYAKGVKSYFDRQPHYLRIARHNYFDFIYYRTKVLFGCSLNEEQRQKLILGSGHFLQRLVQVTERPFSYSQIAALDKYGLKLIAIASYMGRCEFSRFQKTLEKLFIQIDKNYIPSAKRALVHFPNLLSIYDVAHARDPFKEIYLFAIRHGLVWGYARQNRNLPSHIELPEKQINSNARPGGVSYNGFLGKNERVSNVIKRDQKMLQLFSCLDKLKCTSRHLARGLMELLRKFHEDHIAEKSDVVIAEVLKGNVTYRGMTYEITFGAHGSDIQLSPFKDGLQGVADYTIKNITTEAGRFSKPVFVAGVVPYLIYLRQFFEGYGSPYRIDPIHIVNTFERAETTRKENIQKERKFIEKTLSQKLVDYLKGAFHHQSKGDPYEKGVYYPYSF